jgi:integrase
MMVMAAQTGARRSELVRSQVHDFDFDFNIVRLQERKRAKGKRTTRSVPLSPLARQTMEEWLNQTNGRYTFGCNGEPLTVDIASDHFRRTLTGSKWEKIRGWHVFRHSFISNCAAKGIDQRIIDGWSGHQTEAMRRRYTHLFPDAQQAAMVSVFRR